MTSNIKIGRYTEIKPNSVKWKCSISNIIDTCVITLPLSTYLVSNIPSTEVEEIANADRKLSSVVFKEGDSVNVELGYNKNNTLRFKGFVKRINLTTPLQLECEGYSYAIKDKILRKSYASTTVRDILNDVVEGTEIRLSRHIPDIPLRNVSFSGWNAMRVLEWLQKECLLVVYFDFDELYVSPLKYGIPKRTQKLFLGWNTVEDKEFKRRFISETIQINIVSKNPEGQVKRTRSEQQKYKGVKDVKIRPGMPADILKEIVSRLQADENYGGYSGSLTCFLEPCFEKGYQCEVKDTRFDERKGSFFIESVEGSFDKSGGRQKIKLNFQG